MEKIEFLNKLFFEFPKTLGIKVYDEMKQNIENFLAKNESKSTKELINEMYKVNPEIEVFERLFLRYKLISIERAVNTIKVIIVFSFVLAIIGGIMTIISGSSL